MHSARPLAVLLGVLALTAPAGALETDQFYAWGRPLADATDVLNAKANLEIGEVLAQVNSKPSWKRRSCRSVANKISAHFRLLIFHDLELWANNTPLIEKIPADHVEERRFRQEYLMSGLSPIEMGGWIPPSPTIEVAGVRFGTDKLAHFYSEGQWYYRWYRRFRARGLSHEEALLRCLRRGVLSEKTILGLRSSGVFSPADLEANFEGLRFLSGLCYAEPPMLRQEEDGWALARPFDFTDHVTPEWDESYHPSFYTKDRWRKVRPVLLGYCDKLNLPEVQEQRERYARRDRVTPTERRLDELVEAGKLRDPWEHSLDRNCESELSGLGRVVEGQGR